MAAQEKRVAVLGGGIAGLTCALTLAEAGVRVEVIERDAFVGGRAAWLACKATDDCLKCNACLAPPRLEAAQSHPLITIHRQARLAAARREPGGLGLTVGQEPLWLDPAACDLCGLCRESCPQPGALRAAPWAGDRVRLAVDPGRCLYFQDGRSQLCRDACPQQAIDFRRTAGPAELAVQALVVAAGIVPYPAEENDRLGYRRLANVVTAWDLEETLRRDGSARRPSDGGEPAKVAFIQCVGSRNRQGNNYCSRVCCAYALRLGRALAARQGARVTVFYMDLQSVGHAPDEFLAAARSELRLVRAMPFETTAAAGDRLRLEYQPPGEAGLSSEDFDLLVLSVGLTPPALDAALVRELGLGRDPRGFFTEAPGVFVAGGAGGPMDVAEAVASAEQAGWRTLRYLEEQG